MPVLFLALAALLPLFALGGYATLCEPYRPVFRRHRVRVPISWPSLSVLHISDLHVRRSDLRLYRAQKAALAGLTPDLLCVTGDVCEEVQDIDLVIDLLRTLSPRLGTFIVLGNHEHNVAYPRGLADVYRRGWRRALGNVLGLLASAQRSAGDEEGHAMAEAMQAAGLTVLHNQGVRVHAGDRVLWIAGCDSAWAGHADVAASMTGHRPDEACLSLIHEPDLAFDAAEFGANLILAGHTHGGQVRLPLGGAPYAHRVDHRIGIAAGFQRVGEGVLHITAGLGHTIPLRFRCPPEVVWLECEPSAAAADSRVA